MSLAQKTIRVPVQKDQGSAIRDLTQLVHIISIDLKMMSVRGQINLELRLAQSQRRAGGAIFINGFILGGPRAVPDALHRCSVFSRLAWHGDDAGAVRTEHQELDVHVDHDGLTPAHLARVVLEWVQVRVVVRACGHGVDGVLGGSHAKMVVVAVGRGSR